MAGLKSTSAAVAVAALTLAACGSSSSTASHTAGASTASHTAASYAASTSASSATAHGVSVGTASGPDGTYLVGPTGRALYLWVADGAVKSNCSGACATVWPPLLTTGAPVASGGVTASDLGTTNRSNGTKQVTYKGHPLYYFIADHGAGQIKGQGSNSFGAKWWLLTPAGAAITATSSRSSSGSSYGSSSGGTSSGGSTSGGGSSSWG
jgi:predicted lipoprotein with Yx(FWY)xxD motif